MRENIDRDLECLKQGVTNDIALGRLVRRLIEMYDLPDGKYTLEHSDTEGSVRGMYFLNLQLVLPKSRPIRYGTAVVGSDVRLFLRIVAMEPTGYMDMEVDSFHGPYEEKGESCYLIDMRLLSDRAGAQAVSA